MKCRKCGKSIHVHINESGPRGFQSRYFCAACGHSSSMREETRCECGSTFSEFLETGLLGCATCYDVFGDKIGRLVSRYRGREIHSGFDYIPDRMAIVRSGEIAERISSTIGAIRSGSVRNIGSMPDNRINDSILLSIRIRLARNIQGVPYLRMLDHSRRELLDRMLISSGSFLGGVQQRFCGRPEFYTGDEDHLRAQWVLQLVSGSEEREIIDFINAAEADMRIIDSSHSWQHHPLFGFLTACPANSGTGVRISFRMNVRALYARGLWKSWKRELRAAGMEIRGANGEGSYEGEITEISNRHPYPHDLRRSFLRLYGIMKRLEEIEKNSRTHP